MPIDLTLPTIIDFYFSIIEKLSTLYGNCDSSSNEAKAFETEINYYLDLIRQEMVQVAKQYKEDV
jgi:hypothetical protein